MDIYRDLRWKNGTVRNPVILGASLLAQSALVDMAAVKQLVDVGLELGRRLLAVLPGRGTVDWSRHHAARWRVGAFGGELLPLGHVDAIELADLLGIDDQKRRLVANTAQFVHRLPANNALLWGARGTGKSSLIHALLNRYAAEGLRVVEVDKHALIDLAAIAVRLNDEPYRFLLVCDDLSFEADDASYKALKSALEGSVFTQSANILVYATSNRRHLLPEYMADNVAAAHVQGELHESEATQEKVSLSDRFGLWLSFRPFRQDDYLLVAKHWLERLSAAHGADVPWDEDVRKEALRWALARGVRSGRTAYHFAKHQVGSALLESACSGPQSRE